MWTVARWLGQRGHNVIVRGVHVRPSVEHRGDYRDEGDLEITKRIEVKHRQFAFTSADDYPFDSVMVTIAHCHDRAHPKPSGYFILNATCTVAAYVPGDTEPQWTRVTCLSRGRDREFYVCPVSLVRFIDLVIPQGAA